MAAAGDGPGAVVIGTGFGCRIHVPALRNAGFTVRALVGRDGERTRRRADRFGIPHACTTLTDALALDGVDAVTIATPPDTHAPLSIEVCAAGRHVLCEKPFSLDAAEAERMLAAALPAGVTHLVGHEFRWAPDRVVVARAIASGLIGEPRTFSLISYVPFVADPAVRVPSWWFDEERGGGWLGASGSHLVDQARTWFGEIDSVSAALVTVGARARGAEDSFVVRMTTRSGAAGRVAADRGVVDPARGRRHGGRRYRRHDRGHPGGCVLFGPQRAPRASGSIRTRSSGAAGPLH